MDTAKRQRCLGVAGELLIHLRQTPGLPAPVVGELTNNILVCEQSLARQSVPEAPPETHCPTKGTEPYVSGHFRTDCIVRVTCSDPERPGTVEVQTTRTREVRLTPLQRDVMVCLARRLLDDFAGGDGPDNGWMGFDEVRAQALSWSKNTSDSSVRNLLHRIRDSLVAEGIDRALIETRRPSLVRLSTHPLNVSVLPLRTD